MAQTQEEKFSLDAPAINNYLNMILQDMKNYQYLSSNRNMIGSRFFNALLALRQLLLDMPPKGQQYMIEKVPYLQGIDAEKIFQILNRQTLSEVYTTLDGIYRIAIEWLWPNLFEIHFNNAQPRSKETAKIGV